MQTFTLGPGLWLRRLLARNPLVRASDRVQAAAVLVILIVALLAVPVAGAVGTEVYDDLVHTFGAAQRDRHEVQAVATRDSVARPQELELRFLTPIQWQSAGAAHTDDVRTGRMKIGEQLMIWVDNAGSRTTEPLTDKDAAAQAIVAAFLLWSGAVGVATTAWAMLGMRLNRARYRDWDRELDDLADNDGRTNKNA